MIEEDLIETAKRLDKQAKERTPEESQRLFQELGILDERGNIAEGREALVWHLLESAEKMERERKEKEA
jgi:hypothetical protein